MSVVQDWFCVCGHEERDQAARPRCPECDRVMQPIVQGGVRGARFRFADTLPGHDRRLEERVRAVPELAALSTDGEHFSEPVLTVDGKPIVANLDERREAHEKMRADRRRIAGQIPIVIDGGRRAHR